MLPVFAVSAALASPLAYFVGAESGGIHVFGPSSIGKSAMLQAAASVWGRGGTPGYGGRETRPNRLEGAAASATDPALCSMKLVWERLAILRQPSMRSQMGSARGVLPATAHCVNRSPGACSFSPAASSPSKPNSVRTVGANVPDSLLACWISPPIVGLGFGAFDHTGDHEDAGKLADAIKHAGCSSYGTAGPAFVRHLVTASAENFVSAKELMATFVSSVVDEGAPQQIVRGAQNSL